MPVKWITEEEKAEMKEKYRYEGGEMYNKKTGRKLKKYVAHYMGSSVGYWKLGGRNVYANWLEWAWNYIAPMSSSGISMTSL